MAKLGYHEHRLMLRTIRKIKADMPLICAKYDSDWQVYQTWVRGHKDATLYESDDAADLYGTAREMQRQEERTKAIVF